MTEDTVILIVAYAIGILIICGMIGYVIQFLKDIEEMQNKLLYKMEHLDLWDVTVDSRIANIMSETHGNRSQLDRTLRELYLIRNSLSRLEKKINDIESDTKSLNAYTDEDIEIIKGLSQYLKNKDE